jgi:very-short-patch-repair endonuclease
MESPTTQAEPPLILYFCAGEDAAWLIENIVGQVHQARAVAAWLGRPPDAAFFATVLLCVSKVRTFLFVTPEMISAHRELWCAAATTVLVVNEAEDAVCLSKALVEHDSGGEIRKGDAGTWRFLLQKCESPIEERLLLHVLGACHGLAFDVDTQTNVGPYRIDMTVVFGTTRLAVECDGHDFHERTKEQAARDKARDRYLVSQGWIVLRFTGSEVWKDAALCAVEILDIALAKGYGT